jgi:hypothetical protein
MTNRRDASKDLPIGNLHDPMPPERDSGSARMAEINDFDAIRPAPGEFAGPDSD